MMRCHSSRHWQNLTCTLCPKERERDKKAAAKHVDGALKLMMKVGGDDALLLTVPVSHTLVVHIYTRTRLY